MGNQFDDLNFFSKEFPFSLRETFFIYLLNSHKLLGFFVLSLKYSTKLSLPEFSSFRVFFVKAEIIRLTFAMLNPIHNSFFIPMVECSGPNAWIVVSNCETRVVGFILLLGQLLYVHASKRYYVRRNLLLIILVNEKSMIT